MWIEELKKNIVKYTIIVEKLDGNVDEETIKIRKEACRTCPFNVDEKCEKCGCYIDLKVETKVNWNPKKLKKELTHCPEGKWGDGIVQVFL
jgi:hypothetical protein